MSTFLRRITKYAATAAGMSAAGKWVKKKAGTSVEDDPNPGSAQWPPLPGLDEGDMASLEDRIQTSVKDRPLQDDDTTSTSSNPTEPAKAESAADSTDQAWIDPYESGACPLSHPVKVKLSSGIYHTEDGSVYERTRADRCYPDAAAAVKDGFRKSKT